MKSKFIAALIVGLASSGAFAAACSETASTLTTAGTSGTGADTETCVCNGGSAGVTQVMGGSGTPITTTPYFIKNGFNMQCGANTYVSFKEVSATLIGVASGSRKGNQTYKGTSNGGAISVHAKCTGTNDACTAANVTTAVNAASS